MSKEQELLKILIEEVEKCRYAWFPKRLLEAQKQAIELFKEMEVCDVERSTSES